jgi:hypothetical protein
LRSRSSVGAGSQPIENSKAEPFGSGLFLWYRKTKRPGCEAWPFLLKTAEFVITR